MNDAADKTRVKAPLAAGEQVLFHAKEHMKESDVALTLLHTADWHLGRRFPAFGLEQELRLTRARLEVVGRILDLAHSRAVDAVLCAGDLFDQPAPDQQWWDGVLREFQRRDWQRPVVLLPGNHDPLNPRSVYHRDHPFRAGLPGYVHVVDRPGWQLPLGEDAAVFASPCTSHAGQTDLVGCRSRRAGSWRISSARLSRRSHEQSGPDATCTWPVPGIVRAVEGRRLARLDVEPSRRR